MAADQRPLRPESAPSGANPPGSPNRGFASMDPERQREIASVGGKAAHERGTAHEFTPEEARVAGSKGGQAAHERGTAHQFDAQEARAAGRKGGQEAHRKGTAHQFDSQEARAAGRKGGQAGRAALPGLAEPAPPDDGFAPGEDGLCH